MIDNRERKVWKLLLPVALLLLDVPHAAAQETVVEDGSAIILAPITITGLKRSDDADALPNSVSVVNGTSAGLDSPDPGAALARSSPNVYFGGFGQPGLDFVSMRGIGPLGQPANSLDNSVGFSVNGAPTSAFGFPPTTLDIERVEVLRGPQGTLFGRNALGGVINVVTAPADGKREFRLRGEYGTDGHYMTEAIAGGWLQKDLLAARFAARFQGRDGDVPNLIIGGEEGDAKLAAGRGTLRYTPNEDTRITLTVGVDRDKRHNNYNMFLEHPDFPASGSDIRPENSRRRGEATLEIQHDFEGFTFTSLTNFQNITLNGRVDVVDGLLFPVSESGKDISVSKERERLFSQEFRLNSAQGADISWVGGINYFRSEYSSDRDQDSSQSPYSSGTFATDIASQTVAAFADVTLPLNDRLKLSGGIRVAYDDQKLDVDYRGKGFPGSVPAYAQRTSFDDTYWTGRLALSYDWTDRSMTYASIARGYASGGFERFTLNAAVGKPTVPFRPSQVTAYEIGAKARVFDDRLDLSLSGYYNDVKDGQLVGYNTSSMPITFHFVNQSYTTYGLEAQARTEIIHDLIIGAGLGVAISKIDDVTEAASVGAKEDNYVPNVPKFTANIDVSYRFLEHFYTNVQYQYVAKRHMDIANTGTLPEYHMVNAKIGWNKDDFEVYAFANNLLDDRPLYFGATYSETMHSISIGPGRTLGVGVSKSF
ncbi:TonB-dependent receptor [Brucella pseudogrignonensis]|uniref:TonB-dependent receptor n=1 Tax=Brucella pseudogrignonensis TaxID=419475 RepID=UPI0038B611F3